MKPQVSRPPLPHREGAWLCLSLVHASEQPSEPHESQEPSGHLGSLLHHSCTPVPVEGFLLSLFIPRLSVDAESTPHDDAPLGQQGLEQDPGAVWRKSSLTACSAFTQIQGIFHSIWGGKERDGGYWLVFEELTQSQTAPGDLSRLARPVWLVWPA